MFKDIQDCNIISSCDVLSCGFENWLTQFDVFFIGIGEKKTAIVNMNFLKCKFQINKKKWLTTHQF